MNKDILFENEKVLKTFSPKLMSFFIYYLPHIYLVLLGITFLLDEKQFINLFNFIDSYPPVIKNNITLVVFIVLLIIPSLIYGLYKISFRMVLLFSLIGVSGIYLHYNGHPVIYRFILLIVVGVIGILFTDYSRKRYEYYITNFRLILEHKAFRYKKRELLYDRIQDISVQQGIMGKFFRYGNVIPTSSSGVGTGTDSSHLSVGVGIKASPMPSLGVMTSGEKGVIGFRARPNNCLYGIHEPQKNVVLISKMMFKRNEVTKLDELTDIMKEIRDRRNGLT